MATTGREKGSGESQETESGRDCNCRNQFASIIKERNSRDYVDLNGKRLATPARRLPRHAGPAGGGARARACGTPLFFSQRLN